MVVGDVVLAEVRRVPDPLERTLGIQCPPPRVGKPSSDGGLLYRCEELEQVVSCADELPLPLHLLQSPQQELPEATGLFELPEHRLHRLHPLGIALPPSFRPQLPPHTVRQ